MDTSTIAAIATPPGRGGIGIIKISGPKAVAIAGKIFRKSGRTVSEPNDPLPSDPPQFESHRFYYGQIVDPEARCSLDEVLLAVMFAPRTYTRENVVEIQAHSGLAVVNAILELVLRSGARLAAPGEFTKRAFLNGRIDLTQAEAVVDIINARTKKSLEIATGQIAGDLRSTVSSIMACLIDVLAEIEAGIDFPEDIEEALDSKKLIEGLREAVRSPLGALLDHYEQGHILRDGLRLVVVGKPNVGKSSLMNRLLQKDRVIVTAVPGTTRDVVEETLNIHGIPVLLSDSAGLHDTDDPVETIGIRKTQEYIGRSDLILFMVAVGGPLSKEDLNIYDQIKDKEVILVVNKIDLAEEDCGLDFPESWRNLPQVKISALYDIGLDALRNLVAQLTLGGTDIDPQSMVIPNLRHKIAIERCLQSVDSAIDGILGQRMVELIAIDIQHAVDALGEITGEHAKENVLDQIFSRFCIGK
jgi:tRNA modification GTPase